MNTLVIGVGNDYRGDDAVGLIAARRLRELHLPHVKVIESDGEFTRLMECWREAESVIVIDAVQSDARLGTIYRFDVNEQNLSANLFQCSTHAFGVVEAIAMSKALGRLPKRFVVFGVEARSFAMGASLSVEIANAFEELCWLVEEEVFR